MTELDIGVSELINIIGMDIASKIGAINLIRIFFICRATIKDSSQLGEG